MKRHHGSFPERDPYPKTILKSTALPFAPTRRGILPLCANMNKNKNLHILYALPAVFLFVFVFIGPSLFTLLFSITEWRRFKVLGFPTMKHFTRLLHDPVIGKAFYHNFLYIFFTIFLEAGIGLVLAAIMIRLKRSVLLRSLIFSPVILPSIVVGVLWQQIYSKEAGLLNAFLSVLGFESVSWLGVPYTVFSVSIVSGWIWAGFFMAIFYAGFVRIPQSIRESAKLDGATERQIFFKIEIPLIRNLILMALLIVTTGGFKSFDLFKILLRRDPLESGIIVPTLLVRTFFENRDIGYGSVISIVLTVVVLLILLAIRILQQKVVGEIEEY